MKLVVKIIMRFFLNNFITKIAFHWDDPKCIIVYTTMVSTLTRRVCGHNLLLLDELGACLECFMRGIPFSWVCATLCIVVGRPHNSKSHKPLRALLSLSLYSTRCGICKTQIINSCCTVSRNSKHISQCSYWYRAIWCCGDPFS